MFVLDFDGEAGNRTLRSLGLSPHVRTPSGGHHVYVRHPGFRVPTLTGTTKEELATLWPGLDIRGDGGYAVFTGRSDVGEYEWLRQPDPDPFERLPAELQEFLKRCGEPAAPRPTAQPEALFDELREFVITLEPRRAIAQYRRVFEWLELRFARRVWVERSGGSLRAVPRLAESVPDARFVHIIRDGRDCAISMSRHTGFRLMMAATLMTAMLGYDPYDCDSRAGAEKLPGHLYQLLPENFDVEAFYTLDAPPALFGMHWSGEIRRGLAALAELPRERVLTLRYEDIQASPAPCLRRLIEFIDPSLLDEEWIQDSAAMVRPARSSWHHLPPEEQASLASGCRPGLAALTEYSVNPEVIDMFAAEAAACGRPAPISAFAAA